MGPLQFSHTLLKLLAAVLVALEEVEASAAGAEQYGLALLCHAVGSIHGILHALHVGHGEPEGVEELVQFLIVQTHIDESTHFSRTRSAISV